ncbi:ABC transporter permease [Demequina flava]|uniref:ABC transporter permease n=1 Tax=Demequina flava TaxID=1095025 RepID=UPI0007808FEA|nr:ABC transporter permease subunit [Demequina flava]
MTPGPARFLVLVAAIPAAIVVVGGLGFTVAQSLGLLPLVGPARLSVDAYTGVASELPSSIAVSVGIAVASTTLAVLVGGTAAVLIVAGGRLARVLIGLGAATVTVPHLIGAAAIGLLLADSGLLARTFQVPPTDWPSLVGGPWWVAVILEYAWKEAAFVALVVAGTLTTRVARFDETAAVLGANRATRLRLVLLPLAAPSVILTGAITFIYTLGSYEVAWLLGRTYPEPLSVMAVRLYGEVSLTTRPEAAAVAVVIVTLSTLVAAAAFTLLRRSAVWR